MDREQRALRISVVGALLMAALGFAFFIPTDSEAILLDGVFSLVGFVMGLLTSERKRMMAVLSQVGDRRKALMPEPHWYIPAIGVDPQSQDMGFGSALMNHGIARADRDEAPIYLETETERNVSFYRSLGFDVIEEFTPKGVDVQMWFMARRGTTPRP